MHIKITRSFSQLKWGLSFIILTSSLLVCPLLAQTVNPTQLPNPVIPTPSVPPTAPLLPNKPSPLQSPTQESPEATTVEPYKCEVNADKNFSRIPIPTPTQSSGIPDKVPENMRVTRFEFVGNTVFSQDELASKIPKKFTESPISFAELVQAVSEVTKYYNDRGYINSYAVPVPQTMQGGVVKIQVIEGGLESFQVIRTGSNQRLNLNYVCSRIGVAISPLNFKRLLEALQLLQLDPLIKTVSAELKPGTRPERSVLDVRMSEANSFSSHLTLDNSRSPSVGSFRRLLQFNEADLLGLGDGVNLAITNTNGSNALDFSYTLPLNANNGQLRLAAGTTWNKVIEPPFEPVDIKAAARYFNLTLRQPLVRTPTQEFALGLTAERRESDTSFLGVDFPLSPGADEKGRTRISALRFFQEWIQRSEREVLAMRSQFSLGVGAFNATINHDSPDSRFFAWEGQARWLRQLAPDTSLLVRGDVQLADRKLVPLEQFAIGGLESIRGYRQDIELGDNGVFSSVELQLPLLGQSTRGLGVLQLTPFVDFGTVWNSSEKANPTTQTLVSVGTGLRWQLRSSFTARFYWGIPLVNVDTRHRTWQENGLYFSVEYNPF